MAGEPHALETYYTPGRVAAWLRRWEELAALAESPMSARHLAEPYRPGPTPESPRAGARSRGRHADPMGWANVVADLERAWLVLTFNSLEWRVALAQMQGHSLTAFCEVHHLGKGSVVGANRRACERMALALGWEPPPPEAPEQVEWPHATEAIREGIARHRAAE